MKTTAALVVFVLVLGAPALGIDAQQRPAGMSSPPRATSRPPRSCGRWRQPIRASRSRSWTCASKTGLNMVTRMLADDLRERGIIVATISPPPTETDMLRALIGPEGASRQAKPADVIARLIKVIDGLTLESSGADVRPRDEAALVELSMVGRI